MNSLRSTAISKLLTLAFILLFSGCTAEFDRLLGQEPAPISENQTESGDTPLSTATLIEQSEAATPTLAPSAKITADENVQGDNAANEVGSALPTASPTPAITATPVATLTPTVTLPPNLQLEEGARALQIEHLDQAQILFQTLTLNAEPAIRQASLFGLGRAYYLDGAFTEAADVWNQYLAETTNPDPAVYYWLAEQSENGAEAVNYYQLYLDANPDMGSYIWPKIAQYQPENSISLLQKGLESDAYYLTPINTRRALAAQLLEIGDYGGAVAQYQAIRSAAFTENTKGEMTYLIGQTLQQAGNDAEAFNAFQMGIQEFPRAYESYLGLVELVEAERSVDLFQRGLVNYYAKVYDPAISAFQGYMESTPAYRQDTHLYLAWSLEGANRPAEGLAQLDLYLAQAPDDPAFIGRYIEEKAGILTRSVSTEQALETLVQFANSNPEHPQAVWATWRAAVLADRFLVDAGRARTLYANFVEKYPNGEEASQAWFRLGMLAQEQNDLNGAIAAWRSAADYPDLYGRAALVWLIRAGGETGGETVASQSLTAQGAEYYSLRASDLINNRTMVPYSSSNINLSYDEAAAKEEVEDWIRSHFGLDPADVVTSDLLPGLATDPRIIRGQKLWLLGEKELAKLELEAVRTAYADNAQLSYQLALFFRDLGLYRSSILAAQAVLNRAGVSVFDAPSLIGRLAYPTYYADLVLPYADQYGYDPLLHFALIRQESLFEGFATSSAFAQGLSQIIPDTGTYVAGKLSWEGYQNSDLYHPYINLTFGAFYFDQQLALFDENFTPALAAYNGGPGNAIKWYEKAGDDHDLYLETVNFSETRQYIRQIYTHYTVYRYLYGGQ